MRIERIGSKVASFSILASAPKTIYALVSVETTGLLE